MHANLQIYAIMILDKIDELLKEVQELSAKNAEEVEQLPPQSASISYVKKWRLRIQVS